MVIDKEYPIGLDIVIAKLQKAIAGISWSNSITWGDAENVSIYPRCYAVEKQEDQKRYTDIEYYHANGDYTGLLHAEGNKVFFVSNHDVIPAGLNGYFKTKVDIYFMIDLSQAKPHIIHRADAEVETDALEAIKSSVPNTRISRVITGIENIYRGYRYRITDDMQPYHCFKVEMEVLRYKINANC